ncbi:chromosome transmission fidelity [Fusarium albosuccineum]|uniref:Chromosome transmission fidelity n=1 Tax=Fusarium albosuccineum TaxID=1237068 RepID=A0A8H4P449_9HYPO|nr:chromosome transmission fidelity [Fusarium albosuccineum]
MLPKRVLDLGGSNPSIITLKETCDGERGRYICLSYCWGPKPFIKTTAENLEKHKERISICDLPKTFKDAIEITRSLEVKYLWIDALCIIQQTESDKAQGDGANADWNQEFSKMAEIYHNSYLTVASVWANSVEDGCFSAPEHGKIAGGSMRMYQMKHFPTRASTVFALADFPLLTRGWTYQERMLAPRVLYFVRQEILWECLDGRTCQCGQVTYRPHEADKSELHDQLVKTEFDPALQSDLKPTPRIWRYMVVQYSHLRLTYPSDRLPAFSGLAEGIRRTTRQHYLAGLWRDTLLPDLCWVRRSNEDQAGQWRAPSWSWASVNGSIEYEKELYARQLQPESFKSHVEVLEAECSPKGDSLTGEITGGFIRLKGTVITAIPKGKRLSVDDWDLHWKPDGTHIVKNQELFIIPLLTLWESLSALVVQPSDTDQYQMVRIGLVRNLGRITGPPNRWFLSAGLEKEVYIV